MQERDALKTLLSGKETENFQKQMTIEALQKTVQDLQQQLQDAAKKAAADSMMNKKALEKAIAGSVRLCVVAPTVNVHVNDTRHKFKSKYVVDLLLSCRFYWGFCSSFYSLLLNLGYHKAV